MPVRLDRSILEAAVLGLEAQKLQIDRQIADIKQALDGNRPESGAAPATPKRRRRRMSAAARARIAEAQRQRWAKARDEAEPSKPAAPKRKRRISKAGMARIIAATKARWARVRAGKAGQQKTAKKNFVARKQSVKKTPA